MAIALRHMWTPAAADLAQCGRPLWWAVSPAQDLAVLCVADRHLTHTSYIAGWVGWHPDATPFDAMLVIRRADGSVHHRRLASVTIRPGHIALLPDDGLLVVSGRARKNGDGSWQPNAVVYSPDGHPRDTFCLGDDISVMVTDHDGSVWTAYGDEGIYGGHPQSGAGLAGWDRHGRCSWGPGGRLPEWPLQGGSAATEGNRVWVAWYSRPGAEGTFLTRITPATGEVRSWPSPVELPDGIAIRGDRAVLTRRVHGTNMVTVTRAELSGGSWTAVEHRKVETPGDVVLRCGQGRDGTLWLRTGDTWSCLEA